MKAGEDYIGVSVVYFCHDGVGRFLMQKRGNGCRDERGNWDIGAGAVEGDTSVEQTLSLEVLQEYRSRVLEHRFLGYRDVYRRHDGKQTHWVALDFKVLVDPATVRNGEPHKFDEIGWFTLDRLPSPLHSQFPDFLMRYREKLIP